MPHNFRLRARGKWLVIPAIWLVVAIFNLTRDYFLLLGSNRAFSLTQALPASLFFFGMWALLSPLILWFAQVFRIEGRRWVLKLAAHVLLAILFAVVVRTSYEYFLYLLSPSPQKSFTVGSVLSVFVWSLEYDMALYFVVLMVNHALEYFRRFQSEQLRATRLQAHLVQAELQSLKMQLHPHFLFNTHHAIVGLMLKQENDKAIQMLTQLSDLLRLTLENSNTQEVTLRQELEQLQLYLDIQQTRLGDRLVIKKEIAPETLPAQVPNLLLQPLVENSIRHGIAPYSMTGVIEIFATRRANILQLQIRDNGPGLPPDEALACKEGIGLKNTRTRLQQLYGESQQLALRNESLGGLSVTIEIPYHEQ